ncbi:ATP-dependent helicase [Dorea longicatena]|uniref:ATP-dependent helicase n=1 Tax=Dorea longicatena TaxID=88431 RepID=UPI001D01178D|nr:ATP-dependent helicase [Dorea longicatena]MCB5534824.1 ATP-dependent helicase [bacterium MSK17_88]MCB5547292.1 ATP-dependent helicase [Dorea longicatena]MCG4573136.1 ATP-dependent helicase [Dorea longicatena]
MDWNEFVNTFPIQLNQQQQEAVQSTEGAVLLLAVPGSGKTTVLVTRLGYMIYCRNIHPESILTVTYTVAATKDMSKRFADRFGEKMAEKLEFRTINGICARIIQYYGRKIGKTPFELVKEEKNTTGMLVKICQEHGMGYPTESDLKNVRTMITYIKNMMLNDKEIQKLEEESDIRIRGIYQAYCSQMREKKWMDYDDQMLYAYKMLRMDSRLLEHFQNLYPYICVDEAQDTSKIQHAIIALLAAKSENLFMVGDEDQSIYGFRAAYPEALLDFEKDHPGARVLLMEENFRSNAKIVSAADKFIQKNTLRYEKHMKAAREAGADIRKISLKSRKAQYVYLMKIAQECSTETAVLYRDNECAIPLIDLLERKHIPYRMRNAELSFFTHRTVLDIHNIIRFAMNPKDTELFMQIYYRLKLFFRKEDALNYTNISKEKDIPVWDAILQYGNLEEYQQNHVRSLRRQMKKLLDMTGDKAVDQILVYMGYQDYLKKMGMNANKLEIVKMIGSREDSPEKLLERLKELERIIREKKEERECRFILSTMHASKGLEYDTVYLLDVVDGILPEKVLTSMNTASKEEIGVYEEERRLFYVGATRAKNQLNIFATGKPSRFYNELLEKNISAESYQKLSDELGEGVIVKHRKFGKGVVTEIEGEHIRIRFGDDEKKMDLKVLARLGLLEI